VLIPAAQAPQSLLLSLDAVPAQPFPNRLLSVMARFEGVDQGLDFGEFDAGPLGLSDRTERRAPWHARPVFDHRLRAFFSVSSRSLISGSCFHIRTRHASKTSVKGRRSRPLRKITVVLVIVAISGSPVPRRRRRRVCSRQSFRVRSAGCDLHVGASALRFPLCGVK